MRDPLPKIAGRGSLHLEWRRCGKPTCRCAMGGLHGPYIVRRWREDGRQRKALVRANDVIAVLLAIQQRRAIGSVGDIRASLKAGTSPSAV